MAQNKLGAVFLLYLVGVREAGWNWSRLRLQVFGKVLWHFSTEEAAFARVKGVHDELSSTEAWTLHWVLCVPGTCERRRAAAPVVSGLRSGASHLPDPSSNIGHPKMKIMGMVLNHQNTQPQPTELPLQCSPAGRNVVWLALNLMSPD